MRTFRSRRTGGYCVPAEQRRILARAAQPPPRPPPLHPPPRRRLAHRTALAVGRRSQINKRAPEKCLHERNDSYDGFSKASETLEAHLGLARAFDKEQLFARRRFQRRIADNPSEVVDEYIARFKRGNRPLVINTDLAKELCPEYAASAQSRLRFSRCAYDPAKRLSELVYQTALEQEKWSHVIFIAGGAASGKSTVVELAIDEQQQARMSLFVDGTLSNLALAKAQTEAALQRGIPVSVIYAHCRIPVAVQRALIRAEIMGRILTLRRLAETHFGAQNSILNLHGQYPENRFAIRIFDTEVHSTIPLERDMLFVAQNRYETLDAAVSLAYKAFWDECKRRQTGGNPVGHEIRRGFEG